MNKIRKCLSNSIANSLYSLLILMGSLALVGCELKLKEKPSLLLIRLIRGSESGSTVVEVPSLIPIAGHYNSTQYISISTATSSATIYYSTDGNIPTINSTVYTSTLGHIWFLAGKTIKIFATKTGLTDSSVLSGIFSYPPLKSGQTTCYDPSGTTGNIVACAGTKEDGESQSGVARGYTDNGDLTVTDNATGLVWQKCFKGRNNNAACTDDPGIADTATWADAITYCSSLGLAGKTWRLPSRQELETLPDYSLANPSINTSIFPSTVAASNNWSSTTVAANAANAWYIGFGGGDVNPIVKTTAYYVRCVAGLSKDLTLNYTDNNDFTIKDNATGLIWQKCFKGRNNNATCTDDPGISDTATWADAITYCSSLVLAGKTWRLPQINELNSIVDTTKASGATIDTVSFPSTAVSVYWSSTTTGTTNFAWLVNFSNGSVGGDIKTTNTMRVRCVSGP